MNIELSNDQISGIICTSVVIMMAAFVLFIISLLIKADEKNKKWKAQAMLPGKEAVVKMFGNEEVTVILKEKKNGKWIAEIELYESQLWFPDKWKPNK